MRLIAVACVLFVVAVAVTVALGEPEYALATRAGLVLELAAAVVLAVAGAVATDRRQGALLIVTAGAWATGEWANPGAGALVFTTGLLVAPATPALLAHALSRLPAAYVGTALFVGAVLFTDPHAHGCGSCPANLLLIRDAPGTAAALERWGDRVTAVALVASIALIAYRAHRSTPAQRHGLAPVLVPGVVCLMLFAPGGDGLGTAQATAFLALAGGIFYRRLATRRMRARLARLVVELEGGLRERLAETLDDPSLEILYAYEGGWIDGDGTRQALPAQRQLTQLVQDGEVTAVVIYAGAFEDVDAAIRLAIDHERLQAYQRAQLARLRQARAGIVAAADAERRRLERDLHDGAQQALAGLAMAIGLARGTANGPLARAHDHIRAALGDIRALAHATYPAALDEAGLAAALDVLSEWRPHVELGALPDRRLDPALEAGVYFIVAALTEHPARVDVHLSDELVLEVQTSADDLTEVEDRVGALGGRLTVDGTRVKATFACA